MRSMNEVKLVEEMISDMGVLSDTPYKEIDLLAKYYREKGYSKKEVENLIFDVLEKKINNFLKPKWEEIVEKKVKKVFKEEKELIRIDSVYITEAEIELLHKLEDRKERKLLFTLMCLARFNNLCYKNTYNKIYNKSSDVIKLSNIRGVAKSDLHKTYHSLRVKGLIDFFGKGEESNKIVVKCLYENSEKILDIVKLEDLGNLIEDELKIMFDGYKRCECEDCGKAYKPKEKDYSSKYCEKCKKIVKNKQNKQYYSEK